MFRFTGKFRQVFFLSWVVLAILIMAGCGGGSVLPVSEVPPSSPVPIQPIPVQPVPPLPPTPTGPPGPAFSGVLQSGQQPISGASVMLYAIGTSGYGSPAIPLLATPVLSDDAGHFSIGGTYTCPAAGTGFGLATPVYLKASGGSSGSGGGSTNPALLLLAALGPCNALTSSTQVTINEVSTVAVAWALSAFLSAEGNLGSSPGNVLGATIAFANLTNLVDLKTGASPGSTTPDNVSVPSTKIYSLANILQPCAASSGTITCAALFGDSAGVFGSIPLSTADAAMNIVRHPATNVAALFAQTPTKPAFLPTLVSPPADWTLGIAVSKGGLSHPTTVSIDATGDIWVANYDAVLSKFGPLGAPIVAAGFTGGGLDSSFGMTIDRNSDVWVTNEHSPYGVNQGQGSVTELTPDGIPISGTSGYTQGGINFPVAIAADPNGDIWTVNYSDATVTLYQHPATGVLASKIGAVGKIAFPNGIAIDANHNAWVTNQGDTAIARISSDLSSVTSYTCCNSPGGLAIDRTGNVWVANYGGNSFSELSSGGAVLINGRSGGGLLGPQGVAIDGQGTIWFADTRALPGGLSVISGALSSTPGLPLSPDGGLGADALMVEPYGIAIDSAGDVWVSSYGGDFLTEFMGAATPVKTPTVGPPQLP